MHTKTRIMAASLTLALGSVPALAQAQDAQAAPAAQTDLTALSGTALRDELTSRYDAALALTRDQASVAADTPQYLWASQAKAQCGIALGFQKSGTRDAVSIGKCADAAARMTMQPAPMVQQVAAPVANPACNEPFAGIVFFEWDSAAVPDSAAATIQAAAQNLRTCGWKGVSIAGHADRSGSDPYNDALSLRRAEAVAMALAGQGADRGQLAVASFGEREPKVPTPDGERNPQNRRVELTVQK